VTFVSTAATVPPRWLVTADLMAEAREDFPSVGESAWCVDESTRQHHGNPKARGGRMAFDIANVLQVISIFELSQSDVHLVCGPGYHSGVAFFSALHQVLARRWSAARFEADARSTSSSAIA